jgi:hypothetical protein
MLQIPVPEVFISTRPRRFKRMSSTSVSCQVNSLQLNTNSSSSHSGERRSCLRIRLVMAVCADIRMAPLRGVDRPASQCRAPETGSPASAL